MNWAKMVLPNIGFQMKIGEHTGRRSDQDMLKVNITVPEDFKNGEAGMGYSSDDQYREPEQVASYWTYKITGKGGTRMAAVLFRNHRRWGTYIVVDAQNHYCRLLKMEEVFESCRNGFTDRRYFVYHSIFAGIHWLHKKGVLWKIRKHIKIK